MPTTHILIDEVRLDAAHWFVSWGAGWVGASANVLFDFRERFARRFSGRERGHLAPDSRKQFPEIL